VQALKKIIDDEDGPGENPSTAVTHELETVNALAAKLDDATLAHLLGRKDVKVIPDCIVSAQDSFDSTIAGGFQPIDSIESILRAAQGDTSASSSWGLDRIDQQGLPLDYRYDEWDHNGTGSVVYVLDTGVAKDHPELHGRLLPGWAAEEGWPKRGLVETDYRAAGRPCNPHGTHVATTVAGTMFGVAKKAAIVSVQVLSCTGSGSTSGSIDGYEWAVADALAAQQTVEQGQWVDSATAITRPVALVDMASQRNVRMRAGKPVIVMSFGARVQSDAFAAAIEVGHQKGVVTVVAAMNEDVDACGYSPAHAPLAITVGATCTGDTCAARCQRSTCYDATSTQDSRASYSNWGPCVNIFAPGSSIRAGWIDEIDGRAVTAVTSGTSMAAPKVAGVAAQIRTRFPSMSPTEVADAIDCLSIKDVVSDFVPLRPPGCQVDETDTNVTGREHPHSCTRGDLCQGERRCSRTGWCTGDSKCCSSGAASCAPVSCETNTSCTRIPLTPDVMSSNKLLHVDFGATACFPTS